jgi:hypothetical protein
MNSPALMKAIVHRSHRSQVCPKRKWPKKNDKLINTLYERLTQHVMQIAIISLKITGLIASDLEKI